MPITVRIYAEPQSDEKKLTHPIEALDRLRPDQDNRRSSGLVGERSRRHWQVNSGSIGMRDDGRRGLARGKLLHIATLSREARLA
jgi:hypothetical protein